MARGADAKLRRRNKRKGEKEGEDPIDMFGTGDAAAENGNDSDDSGGDDDDDDNAKATKRKQEEKAARAAPRPSGGGSGGIKKTPLILLILMVGTTLLPAFIYLSDILANVAQKHHILGNIGYRLGMGSVPRKRVFSFYEKHDPSKIEDVPTILAKHYGDYPTLVRKLERKYGDYGYFLGWEQDEAPLTLALEQLAQTREYFVHQYWNRYAPQPLKTAARNIRYNVTFLVKKFSKVWKKKIWPTLEPFFGVPKGAEKQKREDARRAREQRARKGSEGTRRKNKDFRDDVEED